MAKQTIALGTIANDGTGTNLRAAGDMINDNFDELYAGSHLVKARAYFSTAGNSTSGSWAKVNLDATSYDTGSIWDGTNKRFIPTEAGYYMVHARMRTSTSGGLAIAIGKNGSQSVAIGPDATVTGTGGSGMIECNGSTDYLELFAFASSARAITTGAFDTYMAVIGPF